MKPVPAIRPVLYIRCSDAITCGERSVWATTRSMKSGPGRWSWSFEIPVHS